MSDAPGSAADLTELLEFLKSERGFDFTGYKRSSLERRIVKRMEEVRVATYATYLDQLQVDPGEFEALFNTILINVTSFFRDAPAWEYVEQEAIPRMLAAKAPDAEIRVWSAGSASGEEAYSMAMLLVRALGEETFLRRVKIYATDVDEDALNQARAAVWSARAMEPVPEDLRERCFERTRDGYAFRKDLRRALIFGRNDLVQDAPISRVDALLCRNALIYFTAETQSGILARLHFALTEPGFLLLGKSEMLLTHGELFRPLELKCRVFAKVPRGRGGRRSPALAGSGAGFEDPGGLARMRDGAFDVSPVAQIVVDREGTVVLVNHQARAAFAIAPQDVGGPLQDLEVSYRPVELRSAIEQAYSAQRSVTLPEVAWESREIGPQRLEVTVAPLVAADGTTLGAGIVFHDVTEHSVLSAELERSRRELEIAHEELQSTVEELETTNEELQSTNEELETTNEELQSTNEELETMNEELQSTNEELETINEELRERTGQVNEGNRFLEAVLTGLEVGVAVIDRRAMVQVWNAKAADLWGLRADEVVGEGFFTLDIGLPVEHIRKPLLAALDGTSSEELLVAAVTRRGRAVTCVVRCLSLRAGEDVTGVIVMMSAAARNEDDANDDGDDGIAPSVEESAAD